MKSIILRSQKNIFLIFIFSLFLISTLNAESLFTRFIDGYTTYLVFDVLALMNMPLLAVALVSAIFIIRSNKDLAANINTKINYYKTGIFLIVIAGLALRLWNLSILDPYTDEYDHILAAQQYLSNGKFEYGRAKIVTYFISLFYWIGNPDTFYEYLHWGRIPGVIFGSLTIIPLYLMAKKISVSVGLISAILWAVSPWAIGVSRTIREYAYYPFFVLMITLVFIKLMELLVDYRRENLVKIAGYSMIVLFFLHYAFFIDNLSTLKISFIIFPTIIIYYLIINFEKIKHVLKGNKKAFFVFSLFIFLFGCFLFLVALASGQVKLDLFDIDKRWLLIFTRPSIGRPMLWWHKSSFEYIAYLLLAIGSVYAYLSKKYDYLLNLLIFSVFIIFFTYFFDRYFKPRYIFYALPFFTILISVGLHALLSTLRRLLHGKVSEYASIIITILFIIPLFNPLNIIYPITSDKHGLIAPTGEYHDKVSNVMKFLKANIQDEDYFVASFFIKILGPNYKIHNDKIHHFVYSDEQRFNKVREFIKNKKQGLMILDYRRNGLWARGYPRRDFNTGRIRMRLILKQDGIYVYRWENNSFKRTVKTLDR